MPRMSASGLISWFERKKRERESRLRGTPFREKRCFFRLFLCIWASFMSLFLSHRVLLYASLLFFQQENLVHVLLMLFYRHSSCFLLILLYLVMHEHFLNSLHNERLRGRELKVTLTELPFNIISFPLQV